jgi:hypothetical protein
LTGDLALHDLVQTLGGLPTTIDQRLHEALGVTPLHLAGADELGNQRLDLLTWHLGELEAGVDQPLQ